MILVGSDLLTCSVSQCNWLMLLAAELQPFSSSLVVFKYNYCCLNEGDDLTVSNIVKSSLRRMRFINL